MFNTAIDQLKAVRGNTEVIIVKLGTVTGLSNGRAQVKLYGDGSASTKLCQYIDGYIPEVNDKVALLPQGKTYIINGEPKPWVSATGRVSHIQLSIERWAG